ncbi:P-loop containing nucleoside triphosphate hydrolase protein, partial [Coemansia reversa NRRL 1564]
MVVQTRAWLEGGSRRAAVWLAELTATQNREMRRVWQAGCTWVGAEQLSDGVASVGGVLLAAHSGATDVGLVVTERVARHVHAAALATARREAVLVQGAAGSGKTALVEWLARRTGNTLVTLHVGGNMDAKVLLGSYVAAQRAGAFEWRAGLLATAVAQGQWVLVEGVDQAPADVVQTLLPLVESHTLFVPSRGEAIRAHPRFRLFATLAGRGRASGDALVGSSMWTRVTLLPPHDDHAEIVAGAFPRLASEAAALARVFASVVAATATRQTSSVVLGTRDLMRWCARLSHRGMHDSFAIFQDAVDVFAAREPDYVRWRALVQRIGIELGVGADRADHYVDQHSPQVVAAGRELTAGRARMALGDVSADAVNHMPFADTRHARCLLEQIAACIQLAEPVLLLGETGTGKTTAVQRLAALAGRQLTVFNLSQQSDAADLLGGFRPVDVARVALQLRDEFDGLFARTLSVRKNAAFLDRVRAAFGRGDWRRLGALFRAGAENAQQMVVAAQDQLQDGPQRKRPRLALGTAMDLAREWNAFMQHVTEFEAVRGARVAFRFVEGTLAQAARTGAWLLLDEVNLAAPETLACLGGLLQRERMLLLPETGVRIACHADFRLFACMNPATDVGKRDLPPALRSGFTELFVHSPDAHADDLLRIIHAHLPRNTPDTLCHRVIAFYREAKALAADHRVVDGAGQRPHYSLRTLVRALTYARDHAAAYSLRRALYDGLVMMFATQLEGQTQPELLRELHAVFDGARLAQLLRHVPPAPSADAVLEQGFWLASGIEGRNDNAEDEYVVTESVEAKIGSLARAVMCGRYPVLIQGPTSAGKTSMVEHLARRTGHRFVRINNHEHTDLQEYLGAYVTRDGRLVFEEGLLVQALRLGHWLVLDELNLAPSDVLEALNRLLDDNRELVIPETQEVVRPHPHFMLFATQNPAGLYGGRKQLSRAFRNRFVELHFDDIPARELQRIVVESCRVPPSHAQLLVDVYGALTQARAHTRIFEARHGFITLRDLFRWARRGAASRDELAEHGYMLLAERTRSADDRSVVRHAIERVFYPRAASGAGGGRVRRAIDVDALYSEKRLHAMPEFQALSQTSDVAWTSAMRRLFVLTALCLRFDEPVLLVGETGTGKTTVCQLLATALGRQLHAVSCHQNTEAADVLGAQRPVRNRNALLLERAEAPFAWHDGPLVQAMHGGGVFLMDELNLADDSVLERLNSVLEPSRTLVLAEQAGARELRAAEGFAFVATMNPGGDYGKRELSPALRNRFTELWAPATADAADLRLLLSGRLGVSLDCVESERCADVMLAFVTALREELHVLVQPLSLRDYLAWADFVARSKELMDVASCVVHGACLVLLDAIGTQGAALNAALRAPASVRTECVSRLRELPARLLPAAARVLATVQRDGDSGKAVGVAPFFVETGTLAGGAADGFALHAPTTLDNATRVLRAMHVGRAVLLEGSPGVGKTALVSTLARVAGHRLERINLSDQTDIMDLFGTDVPAAGGGFAWRDAPFLQALRRGDWVLLDEINLASQSVLEGLNSCLDHRGAVYISELDREFAVARGCRIFAAQNPLAQGGGRKGLPRSFVNRFTAVHVAELQRDDLQAICDGLYGATADSAPALEFNWQMHQKTMVRRQFGAAGAPWEFNLRDVSRLMELARAESPFGFGKRPSAEAVRMLYVHRMRTTHDRDCVQRLYVEVFGRVLEQPVPPLHVTAELLQIGGAVLPRLPCSAGGNALTASRLRSLHAQLPYAESLARCLEMRWMPILVGATGTGKTALVRWMAQATGNHLVEFSMNAAVDTSELLGGFEQVDLQRHRTALLRVVDTLVDAAQAACDFSSAAAMRLARMCSLRHRAGQDASEHLLERVEELLLLAEELFVDAGDQLSEEHLAQAENILTHAGSGVGTPPSPLTLVKFAAAVTRRRLVALQQLESAGRFEWVDGVLVEALERGHWLLVDRANLCSAAVLDRLNGLLEPGGVLHVNEDPARTSPVVPHPRFRMILAVDPHYGELSRAMRNRGVEICLLPAATAADCAEVAHAVGL